MELVLLNVKCLDATPFPFPDLTNDPITGNVTQVQYPLTQGDTPGQTQRPTVNYTYTNNYYLQTSQDEGSHITTFVRDNNNRVTEIDYPDGGSETFPQYNSFGQVMTHGMLTGGTETFTYDVRGLKQTYRNPDTASGNPSARYQYDAYDRVSGITDVFGATFGDANHTTSFAYTERGQLWWTTLPKDPANGNTRHTITNAYNDDGTLRSKTDQLNNVTSYTYDDYRRVKSVATPVRGFGDNGTHTTRLYYDANGTGDDYRYTDSNFTYVTLPSGKRTKAIYDDNRRKSSVTVAYGTSDAATTTYGYDNAGNLTTVKTPNQQPGQQYVGKSTVTVYDERNRPSSITDALNHITSFTYDTAGRKYQIIRPNNQIITYESYDSMNRLLQQRVTQTPGTDAVTQYSYYLLGNPDGQPVGLLKTFKDPKLYNSNPPDQHTYTWDTMGRKRSVQYPLDSLNQHRTEQWSYDAAGRLYQFTNRDNKTQTFSYDALNRMTGFTWNDNGTTPSVSFVYDAASRLTSVDNRNGSNPGALITRAYYNDNLLYTENEQIAGASSKRVTYNYDADGNRASTQYPDTYTLSYTYTGRNQLAGVTNSATYFYDVNGNLSTRTPANSTSSTYQYDALDRVTHITHSLVGATRTFDYGYDDVGNRKWTKREGNVGDVFSYDLNDQAVGVWLNVANPSTTPTPSPNITYDANGNRTNFHPYGTTDTYATDNLNQYTSRTTGNNTTNATYDLKGNLNIGLDGSMYTYDAQNRVLSTIKNGVTMSFTYDGLNRQVSRTVTGGLNIGGGTTFNVWDRWDLIEEYQNGGAMTAAYLYGAGGVIAGLTNGNVNYYYQDGSGSTSHLADSSGVLKEWYRYDLQGTPFVNGDPSNHASAYGVRYLFTGDQWYSELGLYDLRNRFYSPDIGRFLQPDPIGFGGDRTNLYRHCGNNPVKWRDPFGLADSDGITYHIDGPNGWDDVFDQQDYGTLDTSGGESLDQASESVNAGDYNELGQSTELGQSADTTPFYEWGTTPESTVSQSSGDVGSGSNIGGAGGELGSSGNALGQIANNGPDTGGLGVFPGSVGAISGGGGPSTFGFDYDRLGKMLAKAGPSPADAAAMRSFANAIDYGVAYPAAGAVALPLAADAVILLGRGGVMVVQGVRTLTPMAVQNARYVTASIYVGIVIPTSSLTVNNPTVHELLEEIIETPWKWRAP